MRRLRQMINYKIPRSPNVWTPDLIDAYLALAK